MDNTVRALEARVAEMERWRKEFEAVGVSSAELVENAYGHIEEMRSWPCEQSACSRENNIHVHGLEEGAEKGDIENFLVSFIKTELASLKNKDFKLQGCYRQRGPVPVDSNRPRSVVMCFLENTMKEEVLSAAWNKGTSLSMAGSFPFVTTTHRRCTEK